MSEYQFYEFVAIDRPLTHDQMAELRSRSSRATITATSFINEYNWGDLKADPADWMRHYFDAFVYTANWCSCRLALRLPRDAFDKTALQRFATEERTRQEAERRKQREAYLRTLAVNFDQHWNAVHQHAERGTASSYDDAKRAIVDLADAYALASNRDAFDHALRCFMVRHAKRGALVRRLVEAGLWEK